MRADARSFNSPFFSVLEKDPNRPAAKLRALILSDLQAVPQRVAQLAEWLAARKHAFTIDVILVVGISRKANNCVTPHQSLAEQGNDAMTISYLENICPRVIYVPGLHEHPSAWETGTNGPPRLTLSSYNAIAGPFHLAPDLYVVHRRFADGISDKPTHFLPLAWRNTMYAKLTRPPRFRIPHQPSAIVLCSSQLVDDNNTKKFKAIGLLRTVRSLLSLNRSSVPNLDFILAVVPPKMQRVPSASAVSRLADRSLDPGSFAEGNFCITTFVRPDVWDPNIEPDVEEEQLESETAWEVEKTTSYNLDGPHLIHDDLEEISSIADDYDTDEDDLSHECEREPETSGEFGAGTTKLALNL